MSARMRLRASFTLVEMLVAIGIMLVLGAITIAFLPSVQDKERVARGASLLQGWLAMAKNLAIRDHQPRGLRLRGDQNAGKLVDTFQYIEQPDDFYQGGTVSVTDSGVTGVPGMVDPSMHWFNVVGTGGQIDFYGGFAGGPTPPDTSLWPIQKGDYLEIGTTPVQVFRITDYGNAPGSPSPPPTPPYPTAPCTQLVAEAVNPPNQNVPATNVYRFIRQPRVRGGEAPLTLPQNVVVDLNMNDPTAYNNPLPSNTYFSPSTSTIDILFAPSGAVIGAGTGADKIQLWLRDTSEDSTLAPLDPAKTFNGSQILVTVYVRTGQVTTNPVDVTLDTTASPQVYKNPYSLTQDGRSSGL